MWTLTYHGQKTAVVHDGQYIYEFDSLESARNAVKEATQIYVDYKHGGPKDPIDLSPKIKQNMRVIPPQSYPVE